METKNTLEKSGRNKETMCIIREKCFYINSTIKFLENPLENTDVLKQTNKKSVTKQLKTSG